MQPKLRFKEFNDNLSEEKLKNFCNNISSGKSKKEEHGKKYNLYGSTGIIGKVDNALYDGNYILIARVGANAGKINIINNEKCGISDNTLIVDVKDNLIDLRYLFFKLNQLNLNKLTFGSGQPLITSNQLKELNINVPSIKEQERISIFLSKIDKRIENQKSIINHLENVKKGLMQKIFSQEIRFKDINNNFPDWEEKNIADCLKYEQPTKYLVENDEYSNIYKIPVLTANKGFLLGYTNDTKGIYNKGDVIIFDDFTMDLKYVQFNFKVKSSAIKFLTAKNNNNLNFMYELLKSINLKSESHKRNYISVVEKLKCSIPSINEQNKIVNFSRKQDKKINIEKETLKKLQTLKKGLLQQMFV